MVTSIKLVPCKLKVKYSLISLPAVYATITWHMVSCCGSAETGPGPSVKHTQTYLKTLNNSTASSVLLWSSNNSCSPCTHLLWASFWLFNPLSFMLQLSLDLPPTVHISILLPFLLPISPFILAVTLSAFSNSWGGPIAVLDSMLTTNDHFQSIHREWFPLAFWS